MATSRNEAAVFADLAVLARSPGYVHALAHICYRDDFVSYSSEMKTADLQKLFGRERLIRTEVNTLLGLLVQGTIDFEEPAAAIVADYVARTDTLMLELHDTMTAPMMATVNVVSNVKEARSTLSAEGMREPIFYSGEAAYPFQYRDLAVEKYKADNPWLLHNKGFSIEQAQTIARTMCGVLEEKATRLFNEMKQTGVQPTSWLSSFEITSQEIAFRSGAPAALVASVLGAFTLSGQNVQFQTIGDFNAIAATPLIRMDESEVLLFQSYSLYEALYDAPFYWMMADDDYVDTAAQHRGAFAENFAALRLARVFGAQRVHKNVKLKFRKGKDPGEIDVLVVFGDRLIIVETKAKKLTLEARRGNDGQLRKDFAAAIQRSYDQARQCAQAILDGECKLTGSDGSEIQLPLPPKEILIFNVVADHFPALAFQAHQMLRYETTKEILAPFVMDVFLLDALTEMLETPLRLLSYCKLRVENIDRLAMSHELTALSFHLKGNMWVDPKFNMVLLEDDVAVDLDLAMMVRRDDVPGARTPQGVLTRLAGTMYEHLILQIEQQPEPATLELGFLLLALGEETCRRIHAGLEAITRQTRIDGKVHDFTLGDASGGITFHCNMEPSREALGRLRAHCHGRKYAIRAPHWFGVSVDAKGVLQFGGVINGEWEHSEEMDLATADMAQSVPASTLAELVRGQRRRKVGPNERCPCGSGIKFKKCCLQRR